MFVCSRFVRAPSGPGGRDGPSSARHRGPRRNDSIGIAHRASGRVRSSPRWERWEPAGGRLAQPHRRLSLIDREGRPTGNFVRATHPGDAMGGHGAHAPSAAARARDRRPGRRQTTQTSVPVVFREGESRGRVRPASGEGGGMHRVRGCLGRRSGPGTGFPQISAPARPCFHPPETPTGRDGLTFEFCLGSHLRVCMGSLGGPFSLGESRWGLAGEEMMRGGPR